LKILVAEDDRKLSLFLQRVLVEEGFAADGCATGADALSQARSGIYDLLVLDWMLPDGNGIDVCRHLRQEGNGLPILMLTARGEVRERILGLESGADDYLVKPFEIDELVARLHALLRRASGHRRLEFGQLLVDQVDRLATIDGQLLDLTQREFALLVHLAHRQGRIVTRTELLSQVWSTQFDPESNVIEAHMSRLRDKMGEFAWMIDTVRGRGYRLRLDRPR
jgi:DNA-binding response OmpR family regulator